MNRTRRTSSAFLVVGIVMFACCANPGEALAQEAPPSGSAEPTGTQELAKKLINLQHDEGFWVNDSGRFWEKDPVLVTAYSVLALEFIYQAQ